MAIKWIYGDWMTGATSESNTLDVFRGGSTSQNINAEDVADLRISKDKVPASDWTEVIKVDSTLVTLIDTDKAWNEPGAVLFAGKVNKADGKLRDTVRFQVSGYLEHLKAVGFLRNISGTIENPNTGEVFNASNSQGLFTGVITHAVRNLPMQPNLVSTIDGTAGGTGWQANTLYSSNATIGNFLENLRNATEFLTKYNEFRFVPQWANSAKTRIQYVARIGSDEQPQLNASKVTTIKLNDEQYRILTFGLSYTSETQANRIIAQSKPGDSEKGTGADLTVLTVDNGKPLHDFFYSPNVELDEATLKANMQTILNDLVKPKGEASYSFIGSKAEGLGLLGSTIKFVGEDGTDSEGYSVTVRVTAVKFAAESNEIDLDISLPQARYPRLPSSRKRSDIAQNKPNTGYGPGGLGNGIGGDGYNPGGMNGGGSLPGNTKPPTYTPPGNVIPGVTPPDPWNEYKMATGSAHSVAINQEDKLFTWGLNNLGQLGQDFKLGELGIIADPKQLGDDNDWLHVWASASFSYGLKKNGVLYGWGTLTVGSAYFGVGTGEKDIIAKPTKVMENVKSVNVNNYDAVYVITKDDELFVFGNNDSGQLGLGESVKSADKFTKLEGSWHHVQSFQSIGLYGGISGNQSVMAVKTDGSIWHMGPYIEVENGNPQHHWTPVNLTANVGPFKDVLWISPNAAVAMKDNGDVYGWGYANWDNKANDDPSKFSFRKGEFSKWDYAADFDRFPTNNLTPNFIQATAGLSKDYDGIAILKDGSLVRWGTNQASPKSISDDKDWKDVFWRKGAGNNYAIKSNGTLWEQGFNSIYGELGLGDDKAGTTIANMTQVGEGKTWIRVAPSVYAFVIAVRKDAIWVAGYNDNSELGVGYDFPGHRYTQPIKSWTNQVEAV